MAVSRSLPAWTSASSALPAAPLAMCPLKKNEPASVASPRIAGKIVEQVDKEFYSEDAIRAKLLELELHFDLGEINEKDYLELEETLLKMLRVARERKAAESAE